MVSVFIVLLIQIICEVLLRKLSGKSGFSFRKNSYIEFFVSIIGGSLPLALLGSQLIERNGIAVIIALIGFIYFLVLTRRSKNKNTIKS